MSGSHASQPGEPGRVRSVILRLVDTPPLNRLSLSRIIFLTMAVPALVVYAGFAIIFIMAGSGEAPRWLQIVFLTAGLVWLTWLVRRWAHSEDLIWTLAEASAQSDNKPGTEGPDLMFHRLSLDIQMRYPRRDVMAAMAFLGEDGAARRTPTELRALAEQAPPGPREVLRAYFSPPTEPRHG